MFLLDATRQLSRMGFEILQGAHILLDQNWNSQNVCSPFTRLYYIKEGEGSMWKEGKEIPLLPHHVYLIPAGCTFSFACHKPIEKIFFHIRLENKLEYDLFSAVRGIYSMYFSSEDYDALKQNLYEENFLELFRVYAIIFDTLEKITNKADVTPISIKQYSPIIENVISFIHDNNRSGLSIQEIAETFMVAPSTLRNKFKKETGISLGRYINTLLLERAKTLLMDPSHSIQTVADALGFCDQFYFARLFKAKYGITPSTYRRSVFPF